jgi:hypothetical protein
MLLYFASGSSSSSLVEVIVAIEMLVAKMPKSNYEWVLANDKI